jgi:ribosomal protein S27E
MDIGTRCPSCESENTFGLDLRTVIDKLECGDYDASMTQGDLTFYFRPLNYREMTANSQAQFEQQKTLQMLQQTEIAEEVKVERLNSMMKHLVEVTVKALAESITEIRAQGTIVTEVTHIEEFLKNCDRTVFTAVRDRVLSLREASELKPLKIRCPDCQHQYEQTFTLDMSRFFGSDS